MPSLAVHKHIHMDTHIPTHQHTLVDMYQDSPVNLLSGVLKA